MGVREPGDDLLSHDSVVALPSALSGFTAEFGMGSGGSRSLWSPGKPVTPAPLPGAVALFGGKLPPWLRGMSTQSAWVLYGQASRVISTG